MNPDLEIYNQELRKQLEKLIGVIEGLDEAELNWRPQFVEANSIYVVATHALGNVRGWVLGICCGDAIDRDRAAEFKSAGPTAEPLVGEAQNLIREVEAAFERVEPHSLDDLREARQNLWGAGTSHPVSGREAIIHAIEHIANHIGHIEITRDLARAANV